MWYGFGMSKNNPFHANPQNNSPHPHNKLLTPHNILIIFTFLSVLLRMKERLGLEAMLEYMARYREIIISRNPSVQRAVTRAMEMINVERMYYDIRPNKD